MGANSFQTRANGKTAQQAFDAAVRDARHEYGHGGYTGTIAEKHSFVVLDVSRERATLPGRIRAEIARTTEAETKGWLERSLDKVRAGDVGAMVDALFDLQDERIDDKWGPAACFKVGVDEWLFFGMASS